MSRKHRSNSRSSSYQPGRSFRLNSHNVRAKSSHQLLTAKHQKRGVRSGQDAPFMPPEDWYEPSYEIGPQGDTAEHYEIIVQDPSDGYTHAVTADEVRGRLGLLPEWMIEPLEIVQLSRMTRKKQTFPCYGMQWGAALYLYPLESSLIEEFYRPPRPSVVNEARMYGGQWTQTGGCTWELRWTPRTLRDFYLNNILIHELGHLLDDRNTSYTDRERYAEWFAIEYGYLPTLHQRKRRPVRRRHHS